MASVLHAVAVGLLVLTVAHGTAFAGETLGSYQQSVDRISRDYAFPERRAETLAQLLALLQDPSKPPALRGMAAKALGETGAAEAEPALLRAWEETAANSRGLPEPASTDESVGRQYVLDNVPVAIWEIRVANSGDAQQQNALLLRLLKGEVAPSEVPGAGPEVRAWAAGALADRGVQRAREAIRRLPEEAAEPEQRERLSEVASLSMRKLDVLAKHPDRLDALRKTMLRKGHGPEEHLLHAWAMDELAKLDTPEARGYYLDYLRSLERRVYTEGGRWTKPPERQGDAWNTAYRDYWRGIEALRRAGVTAAEFERAGLHPTRNVRLDGGPWQP